MGSVLVGCAMAGQESDGDIVVLEDVNGCRGVAPWGGRVESCDLDEAFKFLKTSPSDYCDMDRTCRCQ